MNTLVSFETAKLLFKKNYQEGSLCRYAGDIGHILRGGSLHNWNCSEEQNAIKIMRSSVYNAPTIAEVVMWLYEKHGIWVYTFRHDFNTEFYWSVDTQNEYESTSDDNFNSPTEAYEAAIEYILNNLV